MEDNKVNDFLNKESENFARVELKNLEPIIMRALKEAYIAGFIKATQLSTKYQKNHNK